MGQLCRIGLPLCFILAATVSPALAATISDLHWLAGCWASVGGEAGSGEQWMPPAGGSLIGVSRTVKDGRTVAHEFLQIRETEPGKIAYIAKPSGQPEATFPLKSAGEREVVFENPEHDFPPEGHLQARRRRRSPRQHRGPFERSAEDDRLPHEEGRLRNPALVLFGLFCACASGSQHRDAILLRPDAPEMNRRAPEGFRVRLETSQGPVVLEVHRDWAPHGADRFYNLVRHGYYDEARFFRVIAGKWAQFGVHGDPQVAALWRGRTLPDDPRREPNRRGTIAFAFAVPNGRTTQLFFNLRDNSETLDPQGFAPFGRVVSGMDAIDSLNAEYGEAAGGGIRRGQQEPLFAGGNAYLAREFPRLDFIRRARIVENQ